MEDLNASAQPVPTSTETQNQIPTTQEKPVGDQLSFIARMEKKIRLEREEVEKQRKEIEERSKKYGGYDELDSLMEKNPLEALKRKGWDYQKLSEHFMSNITDEELDPVQRELKDLRGFKETVPEMIQKAIAEAIGSKEKEYQTQSHEQEIKNLRKTIAATVEANKDKYELINLEGESGLDLVFETIQKNALQQQEDGIEEDSIKLMSFTEAADKVEEYLDTQVQRYLGLNKYKQKSNPPQDSYNKLFQAKTISDDFSPRTAEVSESEEDRVRKAIELIKQGGLAV